MMKYFLSICLAVTSLLAQAHQPDLSSTLLVEQEDGSWILTIRASLTAFEYEVHTKYGEDSYKTPEEFKELVICHLTESIWIGFGRNQAVSLEDGFVKLGHETNVVFRLLGMPKTLSNLIVENDCFKNIHGNQSALIILKKGFEKKQFILSPSNNHIVRLKARENYFELQS